MDAQESDTSMLESLSNELLAEIMAHAISAVDLGRVGLVSRRLYGFVFQDTMQFVWRRSAQARIAELDVDGPWFGMAVRDKGWMWMRRALDPLSSPPSRVDGAKGPNDMHEAVGCLIEENNTKWRFGTFRASCLAPDSHATVASRSGAFRPTRESDEKRGAAVAPYFAPDGYAIVVYNRGGEWQCGDWVRGTPHGRLYKWQQFPNGRTVSYDGQWRDGAKHGHGTLTHGDGSYYVGQFNEDQMHGAGVYYDWVNGRAIKAYEGEWVSGAKHGAGTFYEDGGRVVTERQWNYGLRATGPVTIRHANGDTLVGHHDVTKGVMTQVRLTCSERCRDPTFRGKVIEAPLFVSGPIYDDTHGVVMHLFYYPDPVATPDAFVDMLRYVTRGLLQLPQGTRAWNKVLDLLQEVAAAHGLLPL